MNVVYTLLLSLVTVGWLVIVGWLLLVGCWLLLVTVGWLLLVTVGCWLLVVVVVVVVVKLMSLFVVHRDVSVCVTCAGGGTVGGGVSLRLAISPFSTRTCT